MPRKAQKFQTIPRRATFFIYFINVIYLHAYIILKRLDDFVHNNTLYNIITKKRLVITTYSGTS